MDNSDNLHIVNGDGTNHPFSKSGICGERIIWREGLALGPARYDITEPEFWDLRSDFWNSYKVINNDLPDYAIAFVSEFKKLWKRSEQCTVTLWFEHDLFCQINLIAILSWIYKNPLSNDIQLVSIDRHENHPDFKGLGELSPDELRQLADQALPLSSDDLKFADKIWNLYTNEDPTYLLEFTKTESFPSTFPYLKNALLLHFKRFPSVNNGANEIENKILKFIQINKPQKINTLVRDLLMEDPGYGFGDLEYFMIIHKLETFINSDDHLRLNKSGSDLLNNRVDLSYYRSKPFYLGGARIDFNKRHWRKEGQELHVEG